MFRSVANIAYEKEWLHCLMIKWQWRGFGSIETAI